MNPPIVTPEMIAPASASPRPSGLPSRFMFDSAIHERISPTIGIRNAPMNPAIASPWWFGPAAALYDGVPYCPGAPAMRGGGGPYDGGGFVGGRQRCDARGGG